MSGHQRFCRDDEIVTALQEYAVNFVEMHMFNIFQMRAGHGVSTFGSGYQDQITFYSKDPLRYDGPRRIYMAVSSRSRGVVQGWETYQSHLRTLDDSDEQRFRRFIIDEMKVKEWVSSGIRKTTFIGNWDEASSENKEQVLAEFKALFGEVALAMIDCGAGCCTTPSARRPGLRI